MTIVEKPVSEQSATVLLLPGNMCDSRMWDAVELDSDRLSIVKPVPSGSTIEAMAEHCLEAFEGPLIPIGFSMGGIVALAIAARAPERIAALGLLDTNPFADSPDRARERPRQQEQARRRGITELVAEELKPNYLARQNRENRPMKETILAMAQDLGVDVFIEQSEALRTRPSFDHVLEKPHVPVFVGCGEEDLLCTPEAHRAFAARIPNAELHIVGGAGHMLPMERPDLLSKLLNNWLAKVPAMQETYG